MLLSARDPMVSAYRVEVSGWDSSQSFFVEKAELKWSEETGKRLTLARALRPGSMIFVRLLQAMTLDRSSPVAYQAELVGTLPDGQHQFRLNEVQPRTGPKVVSSY